MIFICDICQPKHAYINEMLNYFQGPNLIQGFCMVTMNLGG